ncbi:phenylalanine--tRNA ligase subunit beta [Methanosarcinales archaeon]|nr:MAG: phenylalanine--tRNA ligase subunit beta [Methanosarcinales archaeon]
MPIVTLYFDDLEELVGIDAGSVVERLPMIGSDVERVLDDRVDVEFFPNRPDLYSVEGLSRAMRSFLGLGATARGYAVMGPTTSITLEGRIGVVRPCIGCAVVRGISLTSRSIESLMGLQESLHWGIGRDRKKASIGVHDLSRVKPPFVYTTVPSDFAFTPLDFEQSLSVGEILEIHQKGRRFAHLLSGVSEYPLIHDSSGDVLSFPPIINGELTRVGLDTEDLFVEVTGLDTSAVNRALNIVVTALAERGGAIEAVEIRDDDRVSLTPDLSYQTRMLEMGEVSELLGVPLSCEDVVGALLRMGFGASLEGDLVVVEVPPYRGDILHGWDLVEDVAIGYGYENFPAKLPRTFTIGSSHERSIIQGVLREIMIGFGYLEVMPFTLTSDRVHFEWMQRQPFEDVVYVENPISEEYTMLRTSLLAGLLKILGTNQHRELPQMIFEVGEVVMGGKNRLHLAAASIHPKANYTEVRSLVDAVMRELDCEYVITGSDDSAYIPNRSAEVTVDGEVVGGFGELHPKVIQSFGLENPIVAMEIRINS